MSVGLTRVCKCVWYAGPEMRQVAGPCSSGQQRNMRLCSQLQEVHRSLLNLLPRMHPPAAAALMSVPPPPCFRLPLFA